MRSHTIARALINRTAGMHAAARRHGGMAAWPHGCMEMSLILGDLLEICGANSLRCTCILPT